LAFQVFELLFCELKRKVLGKPVLVALHCPDKITGFDVVESGQSGVKHHVLTADQIDVAGNALYGNDAMTFWCWPSVHRCQIDKKPSTPPCQAGQGF
jgi:hypothetical protein